MAVPCMCQGNGSWSTTSNMHAHFVFCEKWNTFECFHWSVCILFKQEIEVKSKVQNYKNIFIACFRQQLHKLNLPINITKTVAIYIFNIYTPSIKVRNRGVIKKIELFANVQMCWVTVLKNKKIIKFIYFFNIQSLDWLA